MATMRIAQVAADAIPNSYKSFQMTWGDPCAVRASRATVDPSFLRKPSKRTCLQIYLLGPHIVQHSITVSTRPVH